MGLRDDTALHAERKRLDPPGASGRMGPCVSGGAKPLRDAPLSAQARCWRWGVWIWGAMVGLASSVGKASL